MIIDKPQLSDVPALRRLWQQAFGDTDSYLDLFFSQCFCPEHSLCIRAGGTPVCMLYYFPCTWNGQPLAYLYALATDRAYRNRGLSRRLTEQFNSTVQAKGYAGSVVAPADETLIPFYAKMGYRPLGGMDTCQVVAAGEPAVLQQLSLAEYLQLRPRFLPAGGVLQEGSEMQLLADQVDFYTGKDFLFCITKTAPTFAPEFLGSTAAMPGVLAALGYPDGKFRIKGTAPFAMFRPLNGTTDTPSYFAFILD